MKFLSAEALLISFSLLSHSFAEANAYHSRREVEVPALRLARRLIDDYVPGIPSLYSRSPATKNAQITNYFKPAGGTSASKAAPAAANAKAPTAQASSKNSKKSAAAPVAPAAKPAGDAPYDPKAQLKTIKDEYAAANSIKPTYSDPLHGKSFGQKFKMAIAHPGQYINAKKVQHENNKSMRMAAKMTPDKIQADVYRDSLAKAYNDARKNEVQMTKNKMDESNYKWRGLARVGQGVGIAKQLGAIRRRNVDLIEEDEVMLAIRDLLDDAKVLESRFFGVEKDSDWE